MITKLTDREKVLLSSLRQKGRREILKTAIENNIPKSTMFDTIKKFEIKKLIDYRGFIKFEKVGFPIKIFYLFKVNLESKSKFRIYLNNKVNFNSVYNLNSEYDFFAEGIFRNFKEVDNFEREIYENYTILDKLALNVLDEVKFEDFLTRKNDFEMK